MDFIQELSLADRIKKILEIIQILSKTQLITSNERNELSTLLLKSRKSNDFAEVRDFVITKLLNRQDCFNLADEIIELTY